MKTLIVIPTYNEKDNLGQLVPKIFATLPQTHILFVDDGSPDGTAGYIKSLPLFNSQIFILERPRKMGLGSAYILGFKWGLKRGYDTIFEMDADLSHDPSYLPKLLSAAHSGADLVLGSRYIKGGGVKNWGILRMLLSRGGNIYSRFWLGLPYRDLTGGFKCFSATVLRVLDLNSVKSEGYGFQVELTYRAHQKGFRIQEVPIVFHDRVAGRSKISRKIVLEAFLRVPFLRFFSS